MSKKETVDVFELKQRIETLERQMAEMHWAVTQRPLSVDSGVFTREVLVPQKPQRTAQEERDYNADRFG